MTRTGSSKPVDAAFGDGRFRMARAFLKAARDELTLADDQDVGNPAMSQIVHAAIAYADALTARYGRVNSGNHAAAEKTLKAVFGNRLPSSQQTKLRRILAEKDEVQYGSRLKTRADAERMLKELEAFAEWAEAELERKL